LGQPAWRHWKVASWALVTGRSGSKVAGFVPLVIAAAVCGAWSPGWAAEASHVAAEFAYGLSCPCPSVS